MEIGNRIRNLRISQSLTQKELSQTIGVSVVSLQCWENGTKKPSASAIVSLASAFHVSTDYLLGLSQRNITGISFFSLAEKALIDDYRILDKYGKNAVRAICSVERDRVMSMNSMDETIEPINTESRPKRYIPRYISPSAAGNSVLLGGDDFEMVLVDDSVPSEADYAVGIQGESMLPYINDGDTVYVSRNTDLSVGDVGIFCVDGAMYCKQYYIDDEKNLTLVSANPDFLQTNVYISVNSNSDVRCYGKVLMGYKIPLPDYFLASQQAKM